MRILCSKNKSEKKLFSIISDYIYFYIYCILIDTILIAEILSFNLMYSMPSPVPTGETVTWGHTYGVRDFGVTVLDNRLYVLGGYDTKERGCCGRNLRSVTSKGVHSDGL